MDSARKRYGRSMAQSHPRASFEEQSWNIIRFWARTESCRRARFAERRRIGRGGRGSSEGGYLVATSKCGKAIAGSANGPERVAEARGQDTKVDQSCCGQAQKCTRGHGRRGDYARIPQGAGRSSACVQVALSKNARTPQNVRPAVGRTVGGAQ